MDSQGYEDETNAGIESRGFVVSGEDVDGSFTHDIRPGHPLRFVFWV